MKYENVLPLGTMVYVQVTDYDQLERDQLAKIDTRAVIVQRRDRVTWVWIPDKPFACN